MTGEIKVHVSGSNAVISGILKDDLEPLANAVRQGIAEQHAPASARARTGRQGGSPVQAIRARFLGPEGKRHSRTFQTAKDAQAGLNRQAQHRRTESQSVEVTVG